MTITIQFDDGTKKEFSFKENTVKTVPDFWDCECAENFIHPKTDKRCLRCGARGLS